MRRKLSFYDYYVIFLDGALMLIEAEWKSALVAVLIGGTSSKRAKFMRTILQFRYRQQCGNANYAESVRNDRSVE